MRLSLLQALQGLIERTYATASGVPDMSPYVVGDEGYRRLTAARRVVRAVGSGSEPGPCVLVRETRDATALAVYFPDALIRRLEGRPPTRVLDEDNAGDFADFTEEVDHFIALAHGLAAGRDFSLLELELRANVTKTLVLSHFLARQRARDSLTAGERLWVRHQVFERGECSEGDSGVRARYRDARRYAVKLLDRLERLAPPRRLQELRRWNSLPGPAKIRQLSVA